MSKVDPRKLTDLSKEELVKFFESFDTVFCDLDGVLWYIRQNEVEGAPDGIEALRGLGKQCYFVTNNSTVPRDVLLNRRLKKFNAVEEEIIRPATALIWYLKNINFDKEIYIVGVKTFKEEIANAGFKVVSDEMTTRIDSADAIDEFIKSISPNVGAVFLDFAVNVNFEMLQKCIEYIKKNDALFLVGAVDPIIPFRDTYLIGTTFFVKGVETVSGKKSEVLSKPGDKFNDLIVQQLQLSDPKRVLFIGDSAPTDMAFATKFGYQKLLTLTGATTKEALENWNFDETWKPHYYVDSIKDIHTALKNFGLNDSKL